MEIKTGGGEAWEATVKAEKPVRKLLQESKPRLPACIRLLESWKQKCGEVVEFKIHFRNKPMRLVDGLEIGGRDEINRDSLGLSIWQECQ